MVMFRKALLSLVFACFMVWVVPPPTVLLDSDGRPTTYYGCVYIFSDPPGVAIYGIRGQDEVYWGTTSESEKNTPSRYWSKWCDSSANCSVRYTIKAKKSGYEDALQTFTVNLEYLSQEEACKQENHQHVKVVLQER
jgi:hypothetical protein